MAMQSSNDIKLQFERGQLELIKEVQFIIQMDCSGVYTRPHGPAPNGEIQSIQDDKMQWRKARQLSEKLKGCGPGDYDLSVGIISKKYFESRNKFDYLYSDMWLEESERESLEIIQPLKVMDEVPFEKALSEAFHITLSCNMDYFSQHRHIIEQDLERKVTEDDLQDGVLSNELQADLLHSQLIKLFGPDEKGSERLTLKDFKLLHSDGNFIYASAQRKDNFYMFYFVTD